MDMGAIICDPFLLKSFSFYSFFLFGDLMPFSLLEEEREGKKRVEIEIISAHSSFFGPR